MAGKSNAFAQSVLELIFQQVNITNIANSTGATSLYMSLHTADPGPGGTQSTSEAAYVGYARQAIARTSGGWTITAETISPAATISFPIATGGSETETFIGIGLSSSGAGTLLYSGAISPNITVVSGVTPQITTSTTITES